MNFLLQSDEVSSIEKMAVRTAAMLGNAKVFSASLNSVRSVSVSSTTLSATPVGTVEFVTDVMAAIGIERPEFESYPECLSSFLCRDVNEDVLINVAKQQFVKPRKAVKLFTGGILSEIFGEVSAIPKNTPVWVADRVKFISEWRYYILNHEIVGMGRYDDGTEDAPIPFIKQVQGAVTAMKAKNAPSGYALDFGVLEDGRTALVEANDGWALGFYRGSCSYRDYAALLDSRWQQIKARSNSRSSRDLEGVPA